MRISNEKVLQLAIESIALRGDLPQKTKTEAIAVLHSINPRARYHSAFGFQTKEDWLRCFRTQFEKHRKEIRSAKNYNALKDRGAPTWGTICNHVGAGTWTELMAMAEVTYCRRRQNGRLKTVSASSPFLDRLRQLNDERAELNRQFLAMLDSRREPPPERAGCTQPNDDPGASETSERFLLPDLAKKPVPQRNPDRKQLP